jgi:uncharacterized membrane protein
MAMRNDPRPSPTSRRHSLRVGDAERDDAATQLKEHFAAGRLDFEEFLERMQAALTAKTQGQIARIMADLPRLYNPHPLLPQAPRLSPAHQEEPGILSRYAAVILLAVLVLLWMTAVTLMFHHGYSYQHFRH